MDTKLRMMYTTRALCAFSTDELEKGVWIHAAPLTSYTHPLYGDQTIDDTRVKRFIDNFANNVYGQDIPINYEHFGMDPAKGYKAAGWVSEIASRDDGMWWKVAFTNEATKEIKAGEWRYFSPEWYEVWTDPETQVKHLDVASGGALTNQPFFKNQVPLNFSDLAIEVASLPATNEVADWEHSEPGSGPTPRPDNEDGSKDDQGTRGTSPTIEPTPEDYPTEDSMDEFLKKLAELLELEGEPSEDAVLTAFSERINQTQPLVDALETANEQQAFSERYPREFARMQEQDARLREMDAQAFSDRYAAARVVEIAGEGEDQTRTETQLGFSALAAERIKDMHLAFSTGALTEQHLSGVLDAVLTNGLVDYEEHGSTRVAEETATDDDAVKKAFSEKVVTLVREDKVDHATAVRMVGESHPELARQYAAATRSRR